jgi:hypothetical protein
MSEVIIDLAPWQRFGQSWVIVIAFGFLVVYGVLGYAGLWKRAKNFLDQKIARVLHALFTIGLGIFVLNAVLLAVKPPETLYLRAMEKYKVTGRSGTDLYVAFDHKPNGLRVTVNRTAYSTINIGQCYKVEFVTGIATPNGYGFGLDRISTANESECK